MTDTADDTPEVWFTVNLQSAGNISRMHLYPRGTEATPEAGAYRRGERFKVTDLELALADGTTKEGAAFARICPDFQITQEGAAVTSKKLHDLLVQFDMGNNHLVECRFMDWERKVYRPERFWIISIAEQKAGLDLDAMPIGSPFEEGPNRTVLPSSNVLYPSPHNPEFYFYNVAMNNHNGGGLALKSHVTQGADLWRDPRTRDDIFYFSDRLKRAIDGAKLRLRMGPRFFPVVLT
ncbi:MAG: hypothetical protein AAGE03_18005 [Pseudomonadota bacterium]